MQHCCLHATAVLVTAAASSSSGLLHAHLCTAICECMDVPVKCFLHLSYAALRSMPHAADQHAGACISILRALLLVAALDGRLILPLTCVVAAQHTSESDC